MTTPDEAKHLVARFYQHEVVDFDKSADQGRKITSHVVMVELRVKGDKNASFSRPKNDEDEVLFPDAWARFKREGQVGAVSGIAVRMLPGVTLAMSDELAELGVLTIEDLAELIDTHAAKIKDGMTLKSRAKAYLLKLKDLSSPEQLDSSAHMLAENERLKAELAERPKRRSA